MKPLNNKLPKSSRSLYNSQTEWYGMTFLIELIPPREANLSTKAKRPVPNSGCCSEVSLYGIQVPTLVIGHMIIIIICTMVVSCCPIRFLNWRCIFFIYTSYEVYIICPGPRPLADIPGGEGGNVDREAPSMASLESARRSLGVSTALPQLCHLFHAVSKAWGSG